MSRLRTFFAGLSVVTFILTTAPHAVADPSDYCPEAYSARILTSTVDGRDYRLWIYQPTSNEIHVCFQITGYLSTYGYAMGDLVFRTGMSGSLVPTVTPTTTDPNCDDFVILEDPADVLVEFGFSTSSPYYTCVGIGGTAIRITAAGPSGTANPDVDLLVDRESDVGSYYCTYVAPNSEPCLSPWNYDYTIQLI